MFILQSTFLDSAAHKHEYPYIQKVNALVIAAVIWSSAFTFLLLIVYLHLLSLWEKMLITRIYFLHMPEYPPFLSPTVSAVYILISSSCNKSKI